MITLKAPPHDRDQWLKSPVVKMFFREVNVQYVIPFLLVVMHEAQIASQIARLLLGKTFLPLIMVTATDWNHWWFQPQVVVVWSGLYAVSTRRLFVGFVERLIAEINCRTIHTHERWPLSLLAYERVHIITCLIEPFYSWRHTLEIVLNIPRQANGVTRTTWIHVNMEIFISGTTLSINLPIF